MSGIDAIGIIAMSKKKLQTVTRTETIQSWVKSIIRWVHKNQNWVYIAIIGFCLSVTILYKISQRYGS
jgi:choline-glycine betaine transporter